jgi:hypothetical protein
MWSFILIGRESPQHEENYEWCRTTLIFILQQHERQVASQAFLKREMIQNKGFGSILG